MKSMLSLLALTLSLGAFAQERVVLNSKKVSVSGSEAVIVRTNQTPDTVTITFQVPMADSICTQYAERVVVVTSGLQCGYNERITGYTTRTVCIRRNPVSNACVNQRTERIPVVSRYPRSCPVRESYCASYGTATSYESDDVKIKFKNLPALGDSEVETFRVKAKQKRYDGEAVVYEINALETFQEYEIKDRGFLGSDRYVIQPK